MLRTSKKDLYTVPDLPIKEIIEYYAEIQIQIKPNDILKPTMASTLKLFDTLLELYKGERTADILAKHRNEEDFADFEESLYIVSIYRRMAEFLGKIGIQSFYLKNIAHPDSRKLVGILSVIVNFSMYRDNKRELYERASSAVNERARMRGEIVAKIKKAECNLKRLEGEVSENERTKRDLRDEIAHLEEELREVYRVQRAKSGEVEKIKESKNVLSDKLSSLQLLSLNMKQDIACLKTQVVCDPDKLLELLNEMRSVILKERESMRMLQKRRRVLERKIEQLECGVEKMRRLNKTAVVLQAEDRRIEKLQRETQEIEAQIKNDEAATSSLKIKLGHVNRQISHLESKVLALQDNDRKCAESIAAQLENLKISYEKISDERNAISGKALENMKECKHIEFETFKLKSQHEGDLTDIRSLFCELKDGVLRYTGALKRYMSS
eukprot:jgi/Antlo1/1859/2298